MWFYCYFHAIRYNIFPVLYNVEALIIDVICKVIIKCLVLEQKEIWENNSSPPVFSLCHLWDLTLVIVLIKTFTVSSRDLAGAKCWVHNLQMLFNKINFHCYLSFLCLALTQLSHTTSALENYKIYEIRCRRNILTNCSAGEDLIFSLDQILILISHQQLEAKSSPLVKNSLKPPQSYKVS